MGRILGPRGMTTKQLEQETGCKIMVRGRGSMRDKKKVGKVKEGLLQRQKKGGGPITLLEVETITLPA